MADWDDDIDNDDDEYSAWAEDDSVDTGKAPKFLTMADMQKTSAQLSEMKVDELIRMYRSIRDQLTTDRRGYKKREASMKTFMSVISMNLRDRADNIGTDSFVTAEGTAFRAIKEKFSISDWSAFVEWLKSTENFQAVQKRVAATAIREIRDANIELVKVSREVTEETPITDEEVLPPGVSVFKETEFSVRAPTAARYKRQSAV